MSRLFVVVGGLYGSEGKGAVTAWLAAKEGRKARCTVVRVAGPNAGHSAVDSAGRKWALRQIPVAAVTNKNALLVIAAGSEVDPKVLLDEVAALDGAGLQVSERLRVDPQATLITEVNRVDEHELIGQIGSTGKGIGAARANRLMRRAPLVASNSDLVNRFQMVDTADLLRSHLDGSAGHNRTVIVEGTQGYALGLHAGHYPQTTSSDCRAIDFLSMAGVDPHYADWYECWVVARTFPIRVAGNSGPMLGETSWDELGLEPELTTVTKKIRRVGAWDPDLVRKAVLANGGPKTVSLAITMADYLVPEAFGADGPYDRVRKVMDEATWNALDDYVASVEKETNAEVAYVGTSDRTAIDWLSGES